MSSKYPALSLAALILLAAAPHLEAAGETGWGLSATIGPSQIRDEDDTETFSGNGFGLSAEIEYRFTANFALGLGGFSLGSADDVFDGVDTEIEVRGYNLFGRLIFPMSDSAQVFGRLGAANY